MPIQSLQELFSWLRRRAGLIALFAVLGTIGGLVAAINSERVYSSVAVLQVINPAVGADADSGGQRRAQVMQQRLMARDNMLDLADRYALFDDGSLTSSERVAALREAITIEHIAAPTAPGRTASLSALIIAVNLPHQDLVADIANELAETLVAQSAETQRARAGEALSFYRQEEDRLEQEITSLEDQITAFELEHEDLMPESTVLLRADLRDLTQSRRALERTLSLARGEMRALEAEPSSALNRRRQAQLEDEIAQQEREIDLLEERITELRQVLSQAPIIARDFRSFERRMESLQAQLSDIVQQRREAELGERIEADDRSERLALLEAAVPPEYAISRGRRTIAMLGAVAGLMAGVLIAFAVEVMNPVMRTAQRMERELDLRPVISIPLSRSPRETTRRRLIWLFGFGLLIAMVLALAMQIMGG